MTQTFLILPAGHQTILNLRELWRFRYLFLILIWRTLRVRYQQTVIGVAWVVLQPLLLTFIFAIIFGVLAKIPTDGAPYPIFVMSGLVVWLFVAQALSQASFSILANSTLISRIYFPRVILLMSAIAVAFVDFLFSFAVLVVLMFWYGIAPSIGVLAFMPMLLLAAMTVFGMALWLSALYVSYRDVGALLPFLVQLWMFLSPVIYPSSLLPGKYKYLYALNPIVVVIDTSRWAFAGGIPPNGNMVLVSVAVALGFCVTGFLFFRRMEATFADIV